MLIIAVSRSPPRRAGAGKTLVRDSPSNLAGFNVRHSDIVQVAMRSNARWRALLRDSYGILRTDMAVAWRGERAAFTRRWGLQRQGGETVSGRARRGQQSRGDSRKARARALPSGRTSHQSFWSPWCDGDLACDVGIVRVVPWWGLGQSRLSPLIKSTFGYDTFQSCYTFYAPPNSG